MSSVFPQLYFFTFFIQGLSLNLKLNNSSRQGAHGWWASRIHLSLQLAFTWTVVGIPSKCNGGQPFTCVLSPQLQVFILAQRVLYPLRYLPSPVVKTLNNTQ